MGKVLALLLVILLALASVAGYLLLNEKITAGERQVAGGKSSLKKGQHAIEEGKAKLEAGKQELADGKKKYEQAKDNPSLVLADKLLKGGKGFEKAKEKIDVGAKKVAKGEGKINVEEKRIDAGTLKLSLGMDQLRLAKGARLACALGAAFFVALSIVLGFFWRRSLARIFRHTDT